MIELEPMKLLLSPTGTVLFDIDIDYDINC